MRKDSKLADTNRKSAHSATRLTIFDRYSVWGHPSFPGGHAFTSGSSDFDFVLIRPWISNQPSPREAGRLFQHPNRNSSTGCDAPSKRKNQFLPLSTFTAANRVANVDRFSTETGEHSTDLRIVETRNRTPLDRSQTPSHQFLLGDRKRHTIALGLAISRIEIKQRMEPIVAINASRPIQPLN